jgi:hypothetical protein
MCRIPVPAALPQPRQGDAAAARQHARVANVRRSFLHEVSSQLVKTHDRLCLEDLAVANLIRNKHLARASAMPAGQSSPASSPTSRPGAAGRS